MYSNSLFEWFFYNHFLVLEIIVIFCTIIFARVLANFIYKYTIGKSRRIGIFELILLIITGIIVIIVGARIFFAFKLKLTLFSIIFDIVYAYYEYCRYHKRLTRNKPIKPSKSDKKMMNKLVKKALKKYQNTPIFREAVHIAQKEGYTHFELFINGIRFYRGLPNASFCQNWIHCEKNYTNPNEFHSDTRDIFQTSFMPELQNSNIDFFDLPFHKYQMYSLDVEELQNFYLALQKKLSKEWQGYCHGVEIRCTANGQTTSKMIALTYLFVTKKVLQYV